MNRLISDARDLNPILLWAISMPELYIGAVKRQTEEEIFLETLSILDLVLLDDVKLPTYVEEKENFTIDLIFVNSGLVKDETYWQIKDIYTHSFLCRKFWGNKKGFTTNGLAESMVGK